MNFRFCRLKNYMVNSYEEFHAEKEKHIFSDE